jgi:hypothetical protein
MDIKPLRLSLSKPRSEKIDTLQRERAFRVLAGGRG